ncbi:hypothetical protein [Pseudolysinimonas sp.]|uniref:hypothetical protein n=1 Tax=Pseudolysinimonas sp. TaxID=2680009 RepID=UPI003F805E58
MTDEKDDPARADFADAARSIDAYEAPDRTDVEPDRGADDDLGASGNDELTDGDAVRGEETP